MSTSGYGPQGQPPYPQQSYPQGPPQQAPQPWPNQGQGGQWQGQPSGPQGPRRTSKTPVIIAVAGIGVVLLAVFLFTLLRGPLKDDEDPSPGTAEGGITLGGSLTGQAKQVADALAGNGLECSVRFTRPQGGHAGCFGFDATGGVRSEFVYQYQPDGTVIGFQAKVLADKQGVGRTAIGPVLQAAGPVVFPGDQAKITDAVAAGESTPRATVTGSWGTFEVQTRDGDELISGGKSGADAVFVPGVALDTGKAALAQALEPKGYTCEPSSEKCTSTFGKDGELVVSMTDFSQPGISYLLLRATDTSRNAQQAANEQAFTGLLGTVFGAVQGGNVQAVKTWIDQHRDGKSHSAFVAGWRVDLGIDHGTPYGNADLASTYRVLVSTDALWDVPGD